ncbi:lipopolysaccharide transport system ATP-binding protein [Polynucleobacter sphagniphilus]|uniref:ABC transporter ATP-binding protein n=1 Tax=Polynucleobacter sphagniphilus TaxID=1743169 RepID=UPI0024762567|nr:ABC transporter ATP-binding protein [Polynucleobacter sphagniphilus]MDH6240326.1 lipopolysaccharide transport system ATP-binding protein [Polynucleobacter sphagniphilus]
MSSDLIAVSIESLGKRYEIYNTPGDRLKQFFLPRIAKLLGSHVKNYFNPFFALSDVSFEVKKGQTLGIIGRNGSGKSTLLQIICGTLTPTSGNVRVNGRVAALLELGSGFNPEFTGRENVYLNASILGLSRAETELRFKEIAAFADIGDFIDQPVKTYSSGMMVRLAFAVIAHVDADILVIDEALSVGDAVFTQKCMRFIRKFKATGTLLFVSHDMGSILNLCEEVVWLHQGGIREKGASKVIAEDYLQYTLQEVYGEEARLLGEGQIGSAKSDQQVTGAISSEVENARDSLAIEYGGDFSVSANLSDANGWKTGAGEIKSFEFGLLNGGDSGALKGGEMVKVRISAALHQRMERPILGFLLRDKLGQDLFGENTLPFTDSNPIVGEPGSVIEASFIFKIPMLPNGHYSIMASLADGDLHQNIQHHWMHDAVVLQVASSKVRWGLVGVEFNTVEMKKV